MNRNKLHSHVSNEDKTSIQSPAPENRDLYLRHKEPRIEKLRSYKDSDYDLLVMFSRNEIDAALTMPVMAIIFSIASMFWAPKSHAILWAFFVIFSKFVLLYNCKQFLSLSRSQINVQSWLSRFIAAEALSGIAWASFALVGLWSQVGITSNILLSSHVFLFAALIALLGIRMSFASTVMGILYAGTLPFTLAVTIRLIFLQDPFYFALASMAAGLNIYFLFLAHGLHSTASKMLEYRYQKNELIKKLEASHLRAEQANSAKTHFLATMSHELRTPLNAIMGFSEMIKAETLGKISNPSYVEYGRNIYQSGLHLLSLINDILDLSKIEAGRYQLSEEALWLSDIVSDCRSLLKVKAKNNGITLTINDDINLPQIRADHRALRQICLNLIENALKFTPEGGKITLTIGTTIDGGQYFSVKDTGPGIPQDEIHQVLEPFRQGAIGLKKGNSGSGLGLAIVKKLTELHEGIFELLSESGKGTEAIIILPKKRILSELSSPIIQFNEQNTSYHNIYGQHIVQKKMNERLIE